MRNGPREYRVHCAYSENIELAYGRNYRSELLTSISVCCCCFTTKEIADEESNADNEIIIYEANLIDNFSIEPFHQTLESQQEFEKVCVIPKFDPSLSIGNY